MSNPMAPPSRLVEQDMVVVVVVRKEQGARGTQGALSKYSHFTAKDNCPQSDRRG